MDFCPWNFWEEIPAEAHLGGSVARHPPPHNRGCASGGPLSRSSAPEGEQQEEQEKALVPPQATYSRQLHAACSCPLMGLANASSREQATLSQGPVTSARHREGPQLILHPRSSQHVTAATGEVQEGGRPKARVCLADGLPLAWLTGEPPAGHTP